MFSRQATADCVVCLLLVAAVFAVFGQTARHEFINLDDDEYVYDNPHVLGGLTSASVGWAFTHQVGAHWHPLTILSLMADAELVKIGNGTPDRAQLAAEMHLVNVLLHAANALLLFFLLRRTTGALWRSAAVAAVFAVHPLHVESVAWITERKDVLSGLFGLLALLAYARYARRPSLVRIFWVIFALSLGLMCKPVLVTWPLLFLLMDYWPLQRLAGPRGPREPPNRVPQMPLSWLLLEKIPFLPLIAASAAATFILQRSSGSVASLQSVPIYARLARAAVLYATYIGKSLWPANLAALYPLTPATSYWPALAAALLLLLLTAAALWFARCGRRWFAFGWFWYLISLLPMIGLVQVGSEVMADRFMYLPQIGLSVAAVWLVAELAGTSAVRRLSFSLAGFLVLLALAAIAARQTSFWRDDLTLWKRTVICTTDNYIARLHLGLAFTAHGDLNNAVPQYEEALRVNPNFSEAQFDLASALSSLGMIDAAQRHYELAIRVRPDYVKARNNLGMLFLNRGNVPAAAEQFQKALDIDPNHAMAQNNLGITLMASGRYGEAVACYRRAIALDPDFLQPHANLGHALGHLGQSAEAVAELRAFLRLQPENPTVLGWLAWVLATARDDAVRNGHEALEAARKAAALSRESDPRVLDALAAAYAETGQYPAAIETAKIARDLARRSGQSNLAAEIQQRLELYAASRPFRE